MQENEKSNEISKDSRSYLKKIQGAKNKSAKIIEKTDGNIPAAGGRDKTV